MKPLPDQVKKTLRGTIGGKSPELKLKDEETPVSQPVVEETKETTECNSCLKEIEKDLSYCPHCGLKNGDRPAKLDLGVEISDSDLEHYLFDGIIKKDMEVVKGKLTVTLKTLTVKEEKDINKLLAEKMKQDGGLTQKEYQDEQASIMTAFQLEFINGKPIGDTSDKRIEYIENLGSLLLNVIIAKVNLFNRAVEEILREPDKVKN